MTEHIAVECNGCNTFGHGCMFCEGGLFACKVCGSFEGATTTHCPGERMTAEQSEAVYAGTLDYRDGAWREGECSTHTPAYWSTPAGLQAIERHRAGRS